jgi:hypothetical protein
MVSEKTQAEIDQFLGLDHASINGMTSWYIFEQAVHIIEAMQRDSKSTLRDIVDRSLKIFAESNEVRLEDADERTAEAAKWKAEGDMYGYNFHIGAASGMTSASIIFSRVRRFLEKVRPAPTSDDFAKALRKTLGIEDQPKRKEPV